jgi:RNA polymerase sigma-70 factor (ECF subfamily)
VHADAPSGETTDWSQIVALYDLLHAQRPNPVVAMNRAIAVGELRGALDGVAELEAIDAEPLVDYQPYHAARADLLARAGRPADAVAAYDRALELTTNPAERRFLAGRRAAVAGE